MCSYYLKKQQAYYFTHNRIDIGNGLHRHRFLFSFLFFVEMHASICCSLKTSFTDHSRANTFCFFMLEQKGFFKHNKRKNRVENGK